MGPGSIVNISCSRNLPAEKASTEQFWQLQQDIFDQFGAAEPSPPQLRVKNTTQTSVTLEWDKLQLAQAKLLELAIHRNGLRLTTIPNPLSNLSTKLSGLALDTDYNFHLVLKTTAGTFSSPTVRIRTHTISDTSGVSICFGQVEPSEMLVEAKAAAKLMGAKFYDKIQIDTTHFVATSTSPTSSPSAAAVDSGVEYQKALQLSIPVVDPTWLIACAKEKKMVPIANYYSIGTANHANAISSAQNLGGREPVSLLSNAIPRRASAVVANGAASGSNVSVASPSQKGGEWAEEEALGITVVPPPASRTPELEEVTDAPPAVDAPSITVDPPRPSTPPPVVPSIVDPIPIPTIVEPVDSEPETEPPAAEVIEETEDLDEVEPESPPEESIVEEDKSKSSKGDGMEEVSL